MNKTVRMLASASTLGLLMGAVTANAQTAPAGPPAQTAQTEPPPDPLTGAPVNTIPTAQESGDIVVTGFRESLETQAAIKRDSPQVVDAIVAEDIGKFPDVSLSAALQRVPGVQVDYGNNQEFTGYRIRGLGDVVTTLSGREVFDNVNRGYNPQGTPAEAIARVDVFKSSSANLIEGGVAGAVDFKLHRPFNFKEPTVVLNTRLSHTSQIGVINPTFNFLASDRYDTGAGDIGFVVSGTWARQQSFAPRLVRNFYKATRADTPGTPGAPGSPDTPGFLRPDTITAANQYADFQRFAGNAGLQWQASPELQFYAEGLYTGWRSEGQGQDVQLLANAAQGITNPVASNDCFRTRWNRGGNNPNAGQLSRGLIPAGNTTLDGYYEGDLCRLSSATFTGSIPRAISGAANNSTDAYLAAGGIVYEEGRTKMTVDLAYVYGDYNQENFTVSTGPTTDTNLRFPVSVDFDAGQGGQMTIPGNPLGFLDNRGLFDNINEGLSLLGRSGSWQFRLDAIYDVGEFFIRDLQYGVRGTDRDGIIEAVQFNCNRRRCFDPQNETTNPVFNFTPVTELGLPFVFAPENPFLNNGARFQTVDPDFLRSKRGRDLLRNFVGRPSGEPAFDPNRDFLLLERSVAAYVQANYEVPISGPVKVDGLIGLRMLRDDTTITGIATVNPGGGQPIQFVPTTSNRVTVEYLPSASARIQFGGGLQARLAFSETLTRQPFTSYNPALNYTVPARIPDPNNPGQTIQANIGSGNTGNPNLLPQTSASYDATLEYYWGRGSFVALAGYYRDLQNRSQGDVRTQVIDGDTYNISFPRNVGELKLYGGEIAGQIFFDFLPGFLSRFGVFGNYNYTDSEITTQGDPLEGLPIQDVSKHSGNAGVLYEGGGLQARVSWNYRGPFTNTYITGGNDLRPIDQPVLRAIVEGNSRFDFSIAYDVTENLRVRFEGANFLNTSQRVRYIGSPGFLSEVRYDAVFLNVGARVLF